MAENPTHLETHRGLTKKFRIQADVPTDPTVAAGDVYIDSTAGAEAIGLYNGTSWVYKSLAK
jgi:hypothetical protein